MSDAMSTFLFWVLITFVVAFVIAAGILTLTAIAVAMTLLIGLL